MICLLITKEARIEIGPTVTSSIFCTHCDNASKSDLYLYYAPSKTSTLEEARTLDLETNLTCSTRSPLQLLPTLSHKTTALAQLSR